MAWVSTRGNARNAHAYLRTTRRRSITRFGGGTSACYQDQERQCQPAVTTPRSGAAPAGLALATRTRRGPEPRSGPRGAASLWACSQQALILDPCPLAPGSAGSVGRALP